MSPLEPMHRMVTVGMTVMVAVLLGNRVSPINTGKEESVRRVVLLPGLDGNAEPVLRRR